MDRPVGGESSSSSSSSSIITTTDSRAPLISHPTPPQRRRTKSLTRVLSLATDELATFRTYLRWMCVDQSNYCSIIISWFVFTIFTIVSPILSHFVINCSSCDAKHKRPYDGIVQLSLSSVATLSFVCLSGFVRIYGLRRFLFLDKLVGESEIVRRNYMNELHGALRICSTFVLPCFALEATYKIWWFTSGSSGIPFIANEILSDTIACLLELFSWLYRTMVFFLVCVLFRLICYLQILRLQDFASVFEEDSDVGSVLLEHLRIRRHLKIISHRFRVFILFGLVLVTFSQLASLLVTTSSTSEVNIYVAGELALCSLTLMSGLMIILRSATKITHKAQAITSLAAKWNVSATVDNSVTSSEGASGSNHHHHHHHHHRSSSSSTNLHDTAGFYQTVEFGGYDDYEDEAGGEEDEIDNTRMIPAYARCTLSYQKRQALVTYFEHNRAGITIFGFTLDRVSLQIIFGIELSLVLWLLRKTISIS